MDVKKLQEDIELEVVICGENSELIRDLQETHPKGFIPEVDLRSCVEVNE